MVSSEIIFGLVLFTLGFMVGWFGAWICDALIEEAKAGEW